MTCVKRKYLLGHGTGRCWRSSMDAAISRLGPIPPQTKLALVYASRSIRPHLASLIESLRQRTGIPHWVGTITSGIYTSDREYYDESAVAILVTGLTDTEFAVIPSRSRSIDRIAAIEKKWGNAGKRLAGVLHVAPDSEAGPELLRWLNRRGCRVHPTGGLLPTAPDEAHIANGIGDVGISGVLFHPNVRAVTAVTQACAPIGPAHCVTSSDGGLALAIDERPALDVFYEEAGEAVERDPIRAAGFIYAALPLPRPDAQYLVRSLLSIYPEKGALSIGAKLRNGQSIRFCRRDGNTAWADLIRTIRKLKRNCAHSPRAALYYASAARGRALFGERSIESQLISDTLGEVPLIGCQVNGELAGGELHGYAGVLTLLY